MSKDYLRAFPSKLSYGMSLRDYIAIKAMQGWFTSSNEPLPKGIEYRKNMTRLFYEWADAMLQNREQ